MLVTVWLYAYLRGVLSTRAVEDRCRYDAAFRVACGRVVPGHTTFSRFRRHLLAQDGLAEELFCRVLHVCAAAGLGRLTVVAGDGVRSPPARRRRRTGPKPGCANWPGRSSRAPGRPPRTRTRTRACCPAPTCCWAPETVPPRPDPRSRAGRVLACLHDLEAEREAADAAARDQGRAYLEAVAAAPPAGRPPAAVALAAEKLRLEKAIAAEQAILAAWQARRAAGQRVTRPPAHPGTGKKARKARARLEALQAEAAAEAGQAGEAGNENRGGKAPRRNVTDPDSRLLPVRGGGFTQGYNCQDAAADDRLMLGGYACQDTSDARQAQELARVAEKGAAVVAAGHAGHAADPGRLAKCHGRLCTLPERGKDAPVMTSPPAMPP